MLSLLSCTLGWSNGSIPSRWPARAMATSQRKNSAPRSMASSIVWVITGCPALGQGLELRLRVATGGVGGLDRDEDAVVAVDRGRAQRLAGDGQDALAFLAGALGDQLLDPQPDGFQRRRGDERDLVATLLGQLAEGRAQHGAGVLLDRRLGPAVLAAAIGAIEQPCDVEAHECGRHHAEVRRRRVAAADIVRVQEDLAEMVALARATASSVPGSVIATKFSPAFAPLTSSSPARRSRRRRPTARWSCRSCSRR